jgi:hypothetical protein
MWRIWKYYYRLTKAPHGHAVVAAGITCVFFISLLIVSLFYRPLFAPAAALSLGGVLAMLMLISVLVSRLRARTDDLHSAIAIEKAVQRSGYALTDFFTDGAAANPSLQLFNLKVLSFCQPQNVLELGSGQTTKILSCYARKNPAVYVLTLEQDEAWVNRLRTHVSHDYRHVPLEPMKFACAGNGRQLNTLWYEDIRELHQQRFSYILVDGPDPGKPGTAHTDYSRCGILRYIPGILAESFIIMFDDAERYGETMTINALKQILHASNMRFLYFSVHGIKTQDIICSPDYSYLQSV